MSNDNACKVCKYYRARDTDAKYGFCYRYPPTVVWLGDEGGVDYFRTRVLESETCGEFYWEPGK